MDNLQDIIHPEEIREGFTVDSADKADWAISKAVSAQAEIDKLNDLHDEYVARIALWYQSAIKEHKSTIEYMESLVKPWLQAELVDSKKRSISLPSGVAGLRKLQPKLEVIDEKLALESCRASHPEAIKESLRKSALNDILKAGELVDGCTVSPADNAFYIKGAK